MDHLYWFISDTFYHCANNLLSFTLLYYIWTISLNSTTVSVYNILLYNTGLH